MGAKILLTKFKKTTYTGAPLAAPLKRVPGSQHPPGQVGAVSRVARWKLYAALFTLAIVSGGWWLAAGAGAGTGAGRYAKAQAAATSTPASSAPAKAASPAAAASPAITTTQAAGTPTVRPTPSGPPPAPEDVLTFFGSPTGGLLVKRDI